MLVYSFICRGGVVKNRHKTYRICKKTKTDGFLTPLKKKFLTWEPYHPFTGKM